MSFLEISLHFMQGSYSMVTCGIINFSYSIQLSNPVVRIINIKIVIGLIFFFYNRTDYLTNLEL
jgi:energy-converting hydrogenase Eha subunit E